MGGSGVLKLVVNWPAQQKQLTWDPHSKHYLTNQAVMDQCYQHPESHQSPLSSKVTVPKIGQGC